MSEVAQTQQVEYKSVRIERNAENPAIAEVILSRSEKHNAMGKDFWREFPQVFTDLDQDSSVRVIIVRAEGKIFTVGLDLPEMGGDLAGITPDKNFAEARLELFYKVFELQAAFSNVANCRKPVIAAVHGWCVGAGLELISASDIRLCAADAKFSLRETKVAIVADLGSLQRLPFIIGDGRTRELAFTGKDFDANYADKIGLVTEVFADAESLLEGARKLAHEIAANSAVTVQGTKRVMNEARNKTVDEGLRYVATWNAAFMHSADLHEAFRAFAEKRPPQFNRPD